MDELEMRRIIYDYIKEICHLSQMQVFATSSYQKNFFQMQIDENVSGLINFYLTNRNHFGEDPETVQSLDKQLTEQQIQPSAPNQVQQPAQPLPEITRDELTRNDGSEGMPAYVAVNGTVYDMSQVIQWGGGTHFGLYAGKDLSSEFNICHKGMSEILQKLPKVGTLK
jgi:predicted heme/steroid binding protein